MYHITNGVNGYAPDRPMLGSVRRYFERHDAFTEDHIILISNFVARIQARAEETAVPAARIEGWCAGFDQLMREIFPDGPLDGVGWRDNEGFDCHGFNRDGFDHDGFDDEGYDREGYDEWGRDRDEYDRDGFDHYGNPRPVTEATEAVAPSGTD